MIAKDSELRQATSELETQLKLAATSLSEYKLRAANAETRLSEASSNATRSTALEKEIKEKNQLISKLRHDGEFHSYQRSSLMSVAVVNNEHLTEALRRLRKNTSDNNVDKRLVNNILLAFLSTSRADSKRFEMLSLLSTILGWDDREREKAGLQRIDQKGAKQKSGAKPGMRRKDSAGREERSAEEEAAMNEVSIYCRITTQQGAADPQSPSQISSSSSSLKKPHKVNPPDMTPKAAASRPFRPFAARHTSGRRTTPRRPSPPRLHRQRGRRRHTRRGSGRSRVAVRGA
jgi:hypothetical protein